MDFIFFSASEAHRAVAKETRPMKKHQLRQNDGVDGVPRTWAGVFAQTNIHRQKRVNKNK